jgi:hypothetical protein
LLLLIVPSNKLRPINNKRRKCNIHEKRKDILQ